MNKRILALSTALAACSVGAAFDAAAKVESVLGKRGGLEFSSPAERCAQAGFSVNPSCSNGYYETGRESCSYDTNYKRANCEPNSCAGFDLGVCPDNANCSSCLSGASSRYKLDSCKAGYALLNGACVSNSQWCSDNGYAVPNCEGGKYYSGGTACPSDSGYMKGGSCVKEPDPDPEPQPDTGSCPVASGGAEGGSGNSRIILIDAGDDKNTFAYPEDGSCMGGSYSVSANPSQCGHRHWGKYLEMGSDKVVANALYVCRGDGFHTCGFDDGVGVSTYFELAYDVGYKPNSGNIACAGSGCIALFNANRDNSVAKAGACPTGTYVVKELFTGAKVTGTPSQSNYGISNGVVQTSGKQKLFRLKCASCPGNTAASYPTNCPSSYVCGK